MNLGEKKLITENPLYKNLPLEFILTTNPKGTLCYSVYFHKDGKRQNMVSTQGRKPYQIMAARNGKIILKRTNNNARPHLIVVNEKTGKVFSEMPFGAEKIIMANNGTVWAVPFADAGRTTTMGYVWEFADNQQPKQVLTYPTFGPKVILNSDSGEKVYMESNDKPRAKSIQRKQRGTVDFSGHNLSQLRRKHSNLKSQIKIGRRKSPIPKELTDRIAELELLEKSKPTPPKEATIKEVAPKTKTTPKTDYSNRPLKNLTAMYHNMRSQLKNGTRKSPIPQELIDAIAQKRAEIKLKKESVEKPVAPKIDVMTPAPSAAITEAAVLDYIAKHPHILKTILHNLADSIAAEKSVATPAEKAAATKSGEKPLQKQSKNTPLAELSEKQLKKKISNLKLVGKQPPQELIDELKSRTETTVATPTEKAATTESGETLLKPQPASTVESETASEPGVAKDAAVYQSKNPKTLSFARNPVAYQPIDENSIRVNVNWMHWLGGHRVGKLAADGETLLVEHAFYEEPKIMMDGMVLDVDVNNVRDKTGPTRQHKIFFADLTEWTNYSGKMKYSGKAVYITQVKETDKGKLIAILSNGQNVSITKDEIIAHQNGGKRFGKVIMR